MSTPAWRDRPSAGLPRHSTPRAARLPHMSHATKASWVFCFLLLRTQGQRRNTFADAAARARRPTAAAYRPGGSDRRLSALLQFLQLGLCGVSSGETAEPLQVLNDRIEGTVLVIGRTAKLDARRTLGYDLLFERLHQAGFANARLAAEQAPPGLRPSFACCPALAARGRVLARGPPAALSPLRPPPQSGSALPLLRPPDTAVSGVEMPLSVWASPVFTLKQALRPGDRWPR